MKLPFHWCLAAPLLLALSLHVTSCVTTDDPGSSNGESANKGDADSLTAQGQEIYYGRCTACHNPEPVDYFTLAEWDVLLPEMSEDAKLNAQQQKALRAFIVSELKG